jgi:hypothetical protein
MSQDEPLIPRKGWDKVAGMTSKDRVTVVIDEDYGVLAGNWLDGELVSVGADPSPKHPVPSMPASVPLPMYVAHSHLPFDTRMTAVDWLFAHGMPISHRHYLELREWRRG